jgi:DNA/RNA endonuclease YhcR with UshA esterase domain
VVDDRRPASECPSCGRFVGPYATCPYCGADVGQRLPVRIFKYGSLVLAIAGVVVLLLVAPRSHVPAVRIGDLVGTMNWAYVHVQGIVTQQPIYDPEAGSLKFWLWDGTGEMMVMAYRSEAETLLAKGLVPAMGDTVVLEGTLRSQEEFSYLVLNVPEQMEVRPPEPVQVAIDEIDDSFLYQKVTVQGVMRDDRTPYEGLRLLTLRDATGEIDVALPSVAAALGGEWPELKVGYSLQVTGAVDRYRGTPQISVGRAGDLVLLEEAVAIAASRPIGEISAKDVASMVTIEGTIARVVPFSAGVKIVLDDGSGAITLLLWQDLYESLAGQDVVVDGTALRAQGRVDEYRGELEVVPELSSDVTVLSVAKRQPVATLTPTPTSSPAAEASAEATPLPEPTVPPTLTPEPTSRPTAQPTPSSTPTRRPTPSPSPSPRPTAEVRTIGAITSGDVGAAFTIARAGIADVSYFSKGVKYTLTDPTGSITLLLWQDVIEEIPGCYALFPGSQVRVSGEIDEYQGDLEVIPQAGADVVVIARGERPPLEQRAVNAITPSDEGRIFTVEGRVTRIESHGWLKIWINDGTGELLIFVPERAVEYLLAGIGGGVRLRVTGEVDIYQGVLEIIPLAAADVEVQ